LPSVVTFWWSPLQAQPLHEPEYLVKWLGQVHNVPRLVFIVAFSDSSLRCPLLSLLCLQAQPLHEPEYLVKWSGQAHIHNEWLPESTLLGIARRKLLNFKKRHGDAPVSFVEEQWSLPERFVARRPSPSNPGWEVLVKWQGQVRAGVCWKHGGKC
jgi:hypothetical protein